jgi:hypothetical protein
MTEITNDLSTRLLAQENLLINRAPVRTASFDVRNRILTLPMWQNMTPQIEEMLKAHEVGHAIYTDEELFATKAEKSNIPFAILNILEDARIEKLMKRKYPGLRKTFNIGYAELNEMDFFGVNRRDVTQLSLLDRINLWFKVGLKSGVRFSVAEKYLVERAEKLETIDNVVSLGVAINEFIKRENERKRMERENDAEYKKMKVEEEEDLKQEELEQLQFQEDNAFDDDDWASDAEFSDPEETDEVPDEQQEEVKVKGNQAPETEMQESKEPSLPDDSVDSITQNTFAEKLADSADTSTKYIQVSLPDTSKTKYIRIPYKTYLTETTALLKQFKNPQSRWNDTYISTEKNYDQFRVDTSRIVNYLIKEFEMKKAASDYKRTSVAKTGVLDVRKLASYKIREDLFKQIQITKDGKKHGMVFTIDWSGSMGDYLEETVKQLISLVTFCYRLKIPFEVFAFSDNCDKTREQREYDYNIMAQPNTLAFSHDFQMIEFFSHKMTNSEFNTACKNLFIMSHTGRFRSPYYHESEMIDPSVNFSTKYELNGTPLNEGMMWLYNYVGEFKAANQVEKMTVIKLTDGDANGATSYFTNDVSHGSEWIQTVSYDYEDGERKRTKIVTLLVDKFSKKTYDYTNYSCTNIICKMIQDRYGASVVGYHVVGRGRRELMQTISRYGIATTHYQENDMAIKIRKGFNDEMFYPVNMSGHTEMFLLPNSIKVDDTELESGMANLTSNQIAKKFGKYLGAKKTSRILLNRFVAAVA